MARIWKALPQDEADELEQELYQNQGELNEDEWKHNMNVIISHALDLPKELAELKIQNTFETAIKETTEEARKK